MTTASAPGDDGSPTLRTRADVVALIAAIGTIVLIASGMRVWQGISVGFIASLGIAPIWLPALRRYRGARLLLVVGALALASGIVLAITQDERSISSVGALRSAGDLLTLVLGAGVMLWAREIVGDARVAAWFGVGLIVGISPDASLFSSNPWRFGFSTAVTVLVLALAQLGRSRWLEPAILLAFAALSGATDARSSFGILLLAAVVMAWQAVGRRSSKRGSAVLLFCVATALVPSAYFLAQAVILDGYLGEATQQRSEAQIQTSGSLLLGGRPELAATTALIEQQPAGHGVGAVPNLVDLRTAKEGMNSIGYNPDNGYVERYMFGEQFELHSVTGDLWSPYGIAGIALAAVMLVLLVSGVLSRLASRGASAVLLYVALKSVWNLFFSPMYTSVPLLALALALALIPVGTASATRRPQSAGGA